MTQYIIGVEGATRISIAGLLNLETKKLVAATGPGVNFHCWGDVAHKNLAILLRRVAGRAGLHTDALKEKDVSQLTLGIAGAFGERHLARAELVLWEAGWRDVQHDIVDDTEIALEACGLKPPAIVGIVGVGTGVLGFAAGGRKVKVDGWGPVLGDDGSGYDIGIRGLRAVLRAADGRGPNCGILRSEVLGMLAAPEEEEVRNEEGIVSWFDHMAVNAPWYPWRVGIANLTQAVAEAKHRGDPVAEKIFVDAAACVVEAVRTVVKRMKPGQKLPMALEGFVVREHSWFARSIADQLVTDGIVSRAIVSRFTPVYGALLLAAQRKTGAPKGTAARLLGEALKNADRESMELVRGRTLTSRRKQNV